jgi:hypothetical protein
MLQVRRRSLACAHRPVQRLTQPERLHLHRLTRQHPHIMIDHRQRLLILGQVDPDHHAIARQQPPQPLPPRVAPPVSTRVPLPLPSLIRTSSLAAFGTPSPYYRTRRTFLYQSHHRRTTAPSALSYYYGLCRSRDCHAIDGTHCRRDLWPLKTLSNGANVTGRCTRYVAPPPPSARVASLG